MTAITAYPQLRSCALRREGQSVAAVEKIKPSAGFDGEYAERQQPQARHEAQSQASRTSHSGTVISASNWDAPRLVPQFAAQVIGQVYGTDARHPSAQAAYRSPAPVRRLFDQKV